MERIWRSLGLNLGKYWYLVLGAVVVITGVLSIGAGRIEFATGQDSYLNRDSQEALDNVEFQKQFGGEAVILLFTADDDAIVPDLFSDANRAELARIEAELREIEEVSSVITPLTSVIFSSRIIDEGVGTAGLRHALEDDPDPDSQALRTEDLSTTLFRLGAAGDADLGNRDWVEFLLYDNTDFVRDGTDVTGPPVEDRTLRASLRSTFPDQQTAVGGVVIEGNADLDTLSSATEQVLAIMQTAELEGWSAITTGSPVFLKDINDYLQGGMLTLGAAAFALMALVLLIAFPVRWRLLPLLAVLIAVVWTFSILGFAGIDLSLVTISGLPILIGLGVDFAIQVHNRVEEEVVLDREDHPMRETLANLGPPLGAATVGAVLAFLVLRISLVPMIRDFGVMLAVGIVVILVIGIVVPTAILGIREYKARTTSLTEPTRVERAIVKLGGLPQKAVVPVMVLSVGVLIAGIALEDQFEIQSDPVRWVNQDTQTVRDLETLKEETNFESTLGILIEANNINAQPVADMLAGFIGTWDSPDELRVANSSSMVSTMTKIINIEGATPVAPRAEDLELLIDVMPPDIHRALVADDRTATQVNFRLAPAPLADDAILVAEIQADLERRIAELDLPSDSILVVDLEPGDQAVKAVPAGLAVVGVGLLENLSANRAVLTYLALVVAGLWLLIRHRSAIRALLAMTPVLLAVGMSSVIVAVLGLSLSPLTTVSGPLVIATCTEFSVLILGRYLEERQRGLSPQEATDRASARTGRAFFTSALTTIFGFGVLVFSALPLLSDFGLIVTMNVAVALLSALIVMPPLLVWADTRGLVGVAPVSSESAGHGVRLADRPGPSMALGGVVLVAVGLALFLSADTEEGNAATSEFTAVALPTTTTTTTTTTVPDPDEPPEVIDVSQFGTDPPTEFVPSVLFGLLTGAGADPQRAVCTGSVLGDRVDLDALVTALDPPNYPDEALVPVIQAALDCGIEQATVDAAIEAARGG
ncbi:MAG: MMPL family transporter [Acidimicrobiales bacterium]|nr:MMPL family transporter [Acidimicrobiales bacterium]